MLKESLLYEKLGKKRVRCNICQRKCLIPEGERGYCWTRLNQGGILYTLIYGEVAHTNIAPIEIKPLFHFYPGTFAYSLGTLGCNFRCLGCQNYDIAHARAEIEDKRTEYISPEESIQRAKKYNCQGLSWTYNEPTLWLEYTLDSAKLAKENNLYTTYVTNGYITEESLDLIGPYLDAFRVDIKGFRDDFYKKIANIPDFRGILKVTERAKKKWNMHIEVVTNIIPGYSDDEEQLKGIAQWIYETLGEDTPWHTTRFIPHLKLSHLPPTPLETLVRAREIGFAVGLHFVYLGNVPGHPAENTYCPNCKKLLIKRDSYTILNYFIEEGKCKYCRANLPIRGEEKWPRQEQEL